MEAIRSIDDFRKFMNINRDRIRSNAQSADDISLDDEWMQEDEWDEIYKREVANSGKV